MQTLDGAIVDSRERHAVAESELVTFTQTTLFQRPFAHNNNNNNNNNPATLFPTTDDARLRTTNRIRTPKIGELSSAIVEARSGIGARQPVISRRH